MVNLSVQDVYDIAAEVCEEMMTTFLQNLLKLVPAEQDVIESIEENHFRERRGQPTSKQQMKQQIRERVNRAIGYSEEEEEAIDDEEAEIEAQFEAIRHPAKDQEAKAFLDESFLNQLPKEIGAELPGPELGIPTPPPVED